MNYFLFFTFFVFICLLSTYKFSGDDDVFWHLATGRYIVNTHSVPSADVFSDIAPQTKWIPFEWGWEVLTYSIYQISGYTGLSIFRTLLILLIYFNLFLVLKDLKVKLNLSVIIFILATFNLMARFTPRPHLITYVLLSLVIMIITKVRYCNKDPKLLYWFPLIFLIWGNMHVNGILGLMVFGIFILIDLIEKYKTKNKRINFSKWFSQTSVSKNLLIFFLCICSLLINPFFIQTYIYIYHFLQMDVLTHMAEFMSVFETPNVWTIYNIIYFIFLMLGIFNLIYGIKNKDYFIVLLFAGTVFYSLHSVRYIFDFFIINIVFTILSISFFIGKIRSENIKLFFGNSNKVMIALSAILIFLCYEVYNDNIYKNFLQTKYRETGFGVNKDFYPVELVDFIKSNDINKIGNHIYNSNNCGGYLLWNVDGLKDFIDNRTLSDQTYNEYMSIETKRTGFEEKLRSHQIDYIVYSTPYVTQNAREMNQTLISWLIKNNNEWKLVYWDDKSFLFVKNEAKFKDIIEKYEYRYLNPYNLVFNYGIINNAAKSDKIRLQAELDRKTNEEPKGIFINDLAQRLKNL